MIVFVTTASHAYTHKYLDRRLRAFRRVAYPVLLARRRLPRAVYVFSDFDRLSAWQLELAARVYRQLEAGGCRVLNDPARVLHRLGLLQRLHRTGFNAFDAWPATRADAVSRFPVFIRTQAAHRGVLSGLLSDAIALSSALAQAVRDGHPLHDLMICEYCAQPVRPDLFRKLAVYRVGERMVPSLNVHDRTWVAKHGQLGCADQALYDDERRGVFENLYGEAIRPAFETASIDYGRADFAIVDGAPQVYEINTNPTVAGLVSHPFAVRLESSAESLRALLDAFTALDVDASGSVKIEPAHELAYAPRRLRLSPGYQWAP